MGFFGKSEAELKQIATELDKRQIDLSNRESALAAAQSNIQHEKALHDEAKARLEAERETFRKMVKQAGEDIASKNAELEKRHLELAQLEAEAKSEFAEKQREVFKDVIENRLAELDARQQDLERAEENLTTRYKEFHTIEGEVAKRELAVTEREQKADAGFADKARALADEAARQNLANQTEAERLQKRASALAEERERLESEKKELVAREQSIITAEQKRDTGFADERAALNAELREKRATVESEIAGFREKQLIALEAEIASLRTSRMDEIAKAEHAERDRIQSEIAADREGWAKQQEAARKQLANERAEVERKNGAVCALQSELEGRRAELEASERTLERKEQRLERHWEKRNEELDDEIESRLDEKRKSMEAIRQSYKGEISDLRESLRIQMEYDDALDHIKRLLGDRDPAEILRELNGKTDELKRLREELVTRPTEEMRERDQEIKRKLEREKALNEDLSRQITEKDSLLAEANNLRFRKSELEEENKSLKRKAAILEGSANEAEAELKRLRVAYERPAEEKARYKEIEVPHIKADKVKPPKRDDTLDEIAWLTRIETECENYGMPFHSRILKAFHTALKTAEWSPLTILAGVSGTGKSELPSLYSHFGGLMFELVSVQPNWDSQESMLGFFNSIDNKFDAQPVLHFLAQSQKKWIEKIDNDEGYPGLEDALCLILLDEMNIAHPELYFAEFLSKLEKRRRNTRIDLPSLEVKIGAALIPYKLPLGRNVLWAGTMNQDETTKSLSDKVLDRSIIIHFPRPTELNRRVEHSALDEKNRSPLLHREIWKKWLAEDSPFSENDVKHFKHFIEDMNKSLAVAGRAIGHRVWQSIEYYMANYPDVRSAQNAKDKDKLEKALHIAFEDQLVQKVMPKLRGIDTRGKSMTECLEKIRSQINIGIGGNPFNLSKDFDLACELGYGQFIWQSANYLADTGTILPSSPGNPHRGTGDDTVSNEATPASSPVRNNGLAGQTPVETGTSQEVVPPSSYMPEDPKRKEKWERLSETKKKKYLSPEIEE